MTPAERQNDADVLYAIAWITRGTSLNDRCHLGHIASVANLRADVTLTTLLRLEKRDLIISELLPDGVSTRFALRQKAKRHPSITAALRDASATECRRHINENHGRIK